MREGWKDDEAFPRPFPRTQQATFSKNLPSMAVLVRIFAPSSLPPFGTGTGSETAAPLMPECCAPTSTAPLACRTAGQSAGFHIPRASGRTGCKKAASVDVPRRPPSTPHLAEGSAPGDAVNSPPPRGFPEQADENLEGTEKRASFMTSPEPDRGRPGVRDPPPPTFLKRRGGKYRIPGSHVRPAPGSTGSRDAPR
ncbi:hypothetical protein SKAU_G00413970 [Synaphobranchus kaupii]|uniref:Uncharacterized protein n=1 Tax=Synaphobranchus kaupii TaxID=118154 RepID=A0A9Q1IBC2_SYNKA|nr:hypothetical protein SKAU_G00413970 [Synaphobranchus kaupii]